MQWQEEKIRRYFRCWLEQDSTLLPELFSKKVVYSECHGPEYRGLASLLKWFSDWNQNGRVLEWKIHQCTLNGQKAVTEWFFQCEFHGEEGHFDGVSLIEFDKAKKICSVREFQSKTEHERPYRFLEKEEMAL